MLSSSNSGHAITILVDTIKITMNILQKNASVFSDAALESCSWCFLIPPVPLSARSEWVQAKLSELLETCHYFLLNGEVLYIFPLKLLPNFKSLWLVIL